MNRLLHTEGLVIGHRGIPLCAAIDMELTAGELTCLLGSNGSGKTTLVHTLAGLIAPLEGRVMTGTERVDALSALARARRIAVVLTDRPRNRMMRAHELVSLGRFPWTGISGRLGAIDRAVVEDAFAAVQAAHLSDRAVHTLSDGELQKVYLARGIAQGVQVLLLDEPTAFLDVSNRAELLVHLRTVARTRNMAILFSTHALQPALLVSDRALVLNDGQAWSGTVQELRRSTVLSDTFDRPGTIIDPATGTFDLRPLN